MTRRTFLQFSAVAGAAGIVGAETPARPPNFVIILADDMGYGDLSCYGNIEYATPSIDALAANGLRFTDFHSNGAVCSPTRAALLTGRYPHRLGIEQVFRPQVHREKGGLPAAAVTFAQLLHDAGYATALVGKWHLGYTEASHPLRFGFDEFYGFLSGNVDYHSHVDGSGEPDWWDGMNRVDEPGYSTDLIARRASAFIEANRDRPFCLYVAHAAPHFPYQGPDDSAERGPGQPSAGEGARTDRAEAYREMMESLDENVGETIATLERLGLERDTLVIFCSDNGAQPPGSNGALSGKKAGLFEGGIRVPAIAYWPGRIAAGVSSELALTMDLLPTLEEAAGIVLPEDRAVDGTSLLSHLTEGTPLPPRTVFWRTDGPGSERGARFGRWKLHAMKDKSSLYDLETDLAENNDVSADSPEIYLQLREELAAWEDSVKSVPRLA